MALSQFPERSANLVFLLSPSLQFQMTVFCGLVVICCALSCCYFSMLSHEVFVLVIIQNQPLSGDESKNVTGKWPLLLRGVSETA